MFHLISPYKRPLTYAATWCLAIMMTSSCSMPSDHQPSKQSDARAQVEGPHENSDEPTQLGLAGQQPSVSITGSSCTSFLGGGTAYKAVSISGSFSCPSGQDSTGGGVTIDPQNLFIVMGPGLGDCTVTHGAAGVINCARTMESNKIPSGVYPIEMRVKCGGYTVYNLLSPPSGYILTSATTTGTLNCDPPLAAPSAPMSSVTQSAPAPAPAPMTCICDAVATGTVEGCCRAPWQEDKYDPLYTICPDNQYSYKLTVSAPASFQSCQELNQKSDVDLKAIMGVGVDDGMCYQKLGGVLVKSKTFKNCVKL